MTAHLAEQLRLLRQLSADYKAVCHDKAFPASPLLELVAVKVAAKPAIVPQQARAPAGTGWARRRSAIQRFDAHSVPPLGEGAEDDPLLVGEWLLPDGTSRHLRPASDEPGKLIFWEYSERVLQSDLQSLTAGETPALRQDIAVLAHPGLEQASRIGKLQPVLLYHVYWGLDGEDPPVLRRLFARFGGFDEKELITRPK